MDDRDLLNLLRIDYGYELLDRMKQQKLNYIVTDEERQLEDELDNLFKEDQLLRQKINFVKLEIGRFNDKSKELEKQRVSVINRRINNARNFATLDTLAVEEAEIDDHIELSKSTVLKYISEIDLLVRKLQDLKVIIGARREDQKQFVTQKSMREQSIQNDVKKIEKKLRRMRKHIDEDTLIEYDKKRVSFGKVYYEFNGDSSCPNCGFQIVNETEVVYLMECPNCKRVLYRLQEA